jgi:hypothetical protein
MKKLMEGWNKYTKEVLNEGGLSRVWTHMQDHQTAMITAYRNDPEDGEGCVMDQQPAEGNSTGQKNKARNRDLKAVLIVWRKKLGYGTKHVKGTYIEDYMKDNAVEVKEDSFFVTNLKDDPQFFANMEMLAQKFCQDSVLLIPQGGEGAYLKGTNNSGYPGLGAEEIVGSFSAGEEAEFMTRVKGRPVVFKEELETYESQSRLSRMAISAIAKRVLGE